MDPLLIGLNVMAFVWGSVWGSFLNVVIYRMPRGMSLVYPGSRCGACLAPIRWYDNIPIFSYLILRGKCRRCGSVYSSRYMLIELMCGLLVLALFRSEVTYDPVTLVPQIGVWLWKQTFIYAMVAISFIDLEHLWIPDEISIPMAGLAATGAYFVGIEMPALHLVGAAAGWATIVFVAGLGLLLFRREAMGLGDAKLLAIIGGFCGVASLPFILFASSAQAIIATLLGKLYTTVTGKSDGFSRTTEEADAYFGETELYADKNLASRTVIPYGPFLALAGLEFMLFGDQVLWVLVEGVAGLMGAAPLP